MASRVDPWWRRHELWVEVFAILNLGFLAFDIYLAHSVNQFRNRAEYVPLFFSMIAPILLVAGLALQKRHPAVWQTLGHFVGWTAVVIGLTGVILHLESHFFAEWTLRSLTYSAPFAAPLAYAGLGLLLIMNRMVPRESVEWAQWVLLLTLNGFAGNFVFSLSDHAANGFFYPVEWVPVAMSALAIGFLIVPLIMHVQRKFIQICAGILALEVVTGIWGFILHAMGNLRGPSIHAFNNFIYGAPPLAPLLFPNLAILGMIGLWQLDQIKDFERHSSYPEFSH